MPEWFTQGSVEGLAGFVVGSLVTAVLIWTKKRNQLPGALLLTALIAITLVVAWPQIVSMWFSQVPKAADQMALLGQFGDMFGALTALLGALTFLALLATIWFERRTNAEQRAANTKQSFETTYFQLMKVLQECRPEMLVERMDVVSRSVLARQLAEQIVIESKHLSELDEEERASTLWDHYYRARYAANEDALGPYFRGLYHWFKLIRESAPPVDEMRYANLARAQLSNSELILLAVNCIAYPESGLKQFVFRYGLLKHLRDTDIHIAIRQVMEGFYPAVAFGKSKTP